jgi:hypothetical protein
MYIENTFNYFQEFRRPVKYAMMEIEIVIENSRSLKLRQTRQVDHQVSLISSTASMKPSKDRGYPACQWAERRVRSE